MAARWHYDDTGECDYVDVSSNTNIATMISEEWALNHSPNPGTTRVQMTEELWLDLLLAFDGPPQSLFERDYDRPSDIGKFVLEWATDKLANQEMMNSDTNQSEMLGGCSRFGRHQYHSCAIKESTPQRKTRAKLDTLFHQVPMPAVCLVISSGTVRISV